MLISIVIPVYFNENNLCDLYDDINKKVLSNAEYEFEIIMVNDGSQDKSYEVMQELALKDKRIKTISLSRNFGSHAAILCGLSKAKGDCAVVKAADMQEPSEIVLEMVKKWEKGSNVVLAVRKDRDEKRSQTTFAELYYMMVRKTALPQMPKSGFDVYLIDKKVINILLELDESNSALTAQILWSGFKTDVVYYSRLAREVGTSKWTMRKKIKLVSDTLFSFSTFPITLVSLIGTFSFLGSLIWAIWVLVLKISGKINISGWTTMFIFNLFSFGVVMLTLGIIGGYLWRTFDASRKRPPYIIEEYKDDEL